MRGFSISELARRANLNKGTLSKLEGAGGNPTIETLWALADALGVAFSELVNVESRSVHVVRSREKSWIEGKTLTSLQLDQLVGRQLLDVSLVRFVRGEVRRAGPHAIGAMAHVLVFSGSLRTGPADSPLTLDPMDYAAFPADRPHLYEALSEGTEALVLNSFTHSPLTGPSNATERHFRGADDPGEDRTTP